MLDIGGQRHEQRAVEAIRPRQHALDVLDAPIARVGAPFSPVPFSQEGDYLPNASDIVRVVGEHVTLKPRGHLTIDAGAERALAGGRSLLPVGVVAVEGRFGRGDAVTVRNREGRDLARGLVAYDSEEARRIQGRHSEEIGELLGYRGREEMIHRDNLVLLNGTNHEHSH